MPQDTQFELYKPIRNKLRKLEPNSLLRIATNTLHDANNKGIEVIRHYQPWDVLLILRWTFQEWDSLAHRRKQATKDDFRQLINYMHAMSEVTLLPSNYPHVMLFLPQLAFQQFALQEGPDGAAIARQEMLFANLDPNHKLRTAFKKSTGTDMAEYLDLCYGIMSLLLQNPPPRIIKKNHFRLIESGLPAKSIELFLQHLSAAPSQLAEAFRDPKRKGQAIADQKVLPSLFLEKPLIKIDEENFLILYPKLLMRAVESSIYRELKSQAPETFGHAFGPLFEAHLRECLESTGIPFTDEDGLNRRLGGSGKCVDFLIEESNCRIFIDAKGVEASNLARIANSGEMLIRGLKTSVEKGIEQGIATYHRYSLLSSGVDATAENPEENFLVIVTFDHLYLGSGRELNSIFNDSLIPRLESKYGKPLPIPLAHIFFLTVDEFEALLSLRHTGIISTLTEAFRFARDQDADLTTRKLTFQQHLAELSTTAARLPVILRAMENIAKRVISRIPEGHRTSERSPSYLK